jgi:hypothetical protein
MERIRSKDLAERTLASAPCHRDIAIKRAMTGKAIKRELIPHKLAFIDEQSVKTTKDRPKKDPL